MKFLSNVDKYSFLSEIERIDLFPLVSETWVPNQELIELFIKRRRDTIGKLKDFRKSQNAKSSWRKNRWKHLSGLRTFHRSTKGKRFHRALGSFTMRHDFSGNRPKESFSNVDVCEAVKAISSAITHAHIENEYFHSLVEQVEWELAYEELHDFFRAMEKEIITTKTISEDTFQLLAEYMHETEEIE